MNLTNDEISVLTITPEEWKLVKNSPKLFGEQITSLETTAEQKKDINNQRKQLMQMDYLKFRANTSGTEKTKKESNTNN